MTAEIREILHTVAREHMLQRITDLETELEEAVKRAENLQDMLLRMRDKRFDDQEHARLLQAAGTAYYKDYKFHRDEAIKAEDKVGKLAEALQFYAVEAIYWTDQPTEGIGDLANIEIGRDGGEKARNALADIQPQ